MQWRKTKQGREVGSGGVLNQVIKIGLIEKMAVEVRKRTAQTSRSNTCKGPEVGGQCAWSKVNGGGGMRSEK